MERRKLKEGGKGGINADVMDNEIAPSAYSNVNNSYLCYTWIHRGYNTLLWTLFIHCFLSFKIISVLFFLLMLFFSKPGLRTTEAETTKHVPVFTISL